MHQESHLRNLNYRILFNLSLSTGIEPEKIKIAEEVPIFKKDDPEILSNYRPVSVLPCLQKLLKDITDL